MTVDKEITKFRHLIPFVGLYFCLADPVSEAGEFFGLVVLNVLWLFGLGIAIGGVTLG